MFYWQLLIVCALFIITVHSAWPNEIDNSKMCLHFTGSFDGDFKCLTYCKGKGKKAGSCIKKRCVCHNASQGKEDSNESKKQDQQSSSYVKPKSTVRCALSSTICRLNCNTMENSDGLCINGACVCLRL